MKGSSNPFEISTLQSRSIVSLTMFFFLLLFFSRIAQLFATMFYDFDHSNSLDIFPGDAENFHRD